MNRGIQAHFDGMGGGGGRESGNVDLGLRKCARMVEQLGQRTYTSFIGDVQNQSTLRH